MQEAPASVEGNEALRRCVRDLVALSTLPAIWGNARRPQIAESLSEILTRALALDLAYVRVCSAHEPDVEAVHDRQGLLGEAAARAAASALGPSLVPAGVDQPRVVPHPAGDGTLRLVVVPLGHQNDVGLLAAGAARPDFPNETDRLLLNVAANQAAMVLQRRQAEDQLQRSQSDLADSLRALTEADRRKDEFLAILAHELRNPLAPLRNAVEILSAKGPASPELQWARGVIGRQVDQMTRLVDDLLDVSRISRGTIELRKERVALAAVVSTTLEASRATVEKWGHELTVVLPAEPLVVEGDIVRLGQVLLNLLDNACKYTDPGGRISLVAERDGAHAVIRVRDSGIGIPQERLTDIFDMFTQVDRSLERSQGGLGIGLTLVSRLAAMHGGSVEAHSEGPGRGS
ncbi:MAG TPA: GAF domain-containing sensor histidine kinase, partial [Thermoanaerobaculia bacterium]|nr:GAF domain-containing sensor histidine kinase [Thermoanaerobaculia bacterium]